MADSSINDNLKAVRTMEDIVNLLSILFTNLNNQNEMYYDMFLNPVPMDLDLERYDENGKLVTVVLPNVAKMRIVAYSGEGSPNGRQAADIGALYIDTLTKEIYYKAFGTGKDGWQLIWSTSNFVEGINYLTPTGNGSQLQNLSADSINSGTLLVARGGTGVNSITGLIKGNGTTPFTAAVVDEDYLAPSSLTGLIMSCPFETIPDGWLICDNTIYDISRNPELTRLCNKLGNKYGGDGITTFGVPNLVGAYVDPDTGETKYRGRYVKYGMPSAVGTSEEAHVGEHNHEVIGSTAVDGAHTHDRGSMEILGGFSQESTGVKVKGAFSLGAVVSGQTSEPGGKKDRYIEFKASDGWTGVTSATPHQHSINITASSGGYGTNDVDHIVMVPIIKY